ncbi:cytochrome b [Pseudoalteromonas sp. A25]|uniref:cytochrome b n=1 Tax=Pseudoalteromonas sp. A25 TaxID=116092 RepID=UPI001561BD5E|nr:cytochrome b/b6 domain-containing protein [Pseudoalteromonas sp. A25]
MEDKTVKFDSTARTLHWISAVVIVWAMLSGLYVSLLSALHLDQAHSMQVIKRFITDFNVSLTALYIPLFVMRVLHVLRTKKPHYGDMLSPAQIKMANAAHICMYILIATLLCSGMLMMNRPFGIFGLFTMMPIITDPQWLNVYSDIHQYSSYVLLVFIILHLGALLKHQRSGNRILQRML